MVDRLVTLSRGLHARGLDVAPSDTLDAAAALTHLDLGDLAAGRRAELRACLRATLVKGPESADPGSVVFEAIRRAQAEGASLVLADTAGRLHAKLPLMEELRKVKRVMAKAQPDAPHEVLLVLDATVGQNAIAQAKQFH